MRTVLLIMLLLCTSAVAAQTGERNAGSNSPTDVLAGKWLGQWESRRNNGQMEIEARTADGGDVTGRMRATFANPINCSTNWEILRGTKKGEKFFARYDLKGVCGKTDIVFSIEGDVMSGTWAGEYGGNGTFRLTRQ